MLWLIIINNNNNNNISYFIDSIGEIVVGQLPDSTEWRYPLSYQVAPDDYLLQTAIIYIFIFELLLVWSHLFNCVYWQMSITVEIHRKHNQSAKLIKIIKV